MSLFVSSFFIWVITLISSLVFVLIFLGVNPYQVSINYIITFFISLFVSLSGILTLLGFYVRDFILQKSTSATLITALRQGFLISLLGISILIMYATGTFVWWQAGLLVLVIALLEIYFR